jgi:F-type H+-transporting ATPase subunit delta
LSLSTTARPYAQALFDHSEGWSEDLDQIVSAMSEGAVGLLISSPEKAYREKTEIFVDLFDGQVQQKTINFLKVLGEAKRLSLLPTISSEYKKLLAEKDSSSELTITSAYELTKEQTDSITKGLEKRYGNNVNVKSEVDSTLIGGFSVKCGDEVIDHSIKGRLDKLINQIK